MLVRDYINALEKAVGEVNWVAFSDLLNQTEDYETLKNFHIATNVGLIGFSGKNR